MGSDYGILSRDPDSRGAFSTFGEQVAASVGSPAILGPTPAISRGRRTSLNRGQRRVVSAQIRTNIGMCGEGFLNAVFHTAIKMGIGSPGESVDFRDSARHPCPGSHGHRPTCPDTPHTHPPTPKKQTMIRMGHICRPRLIRAVRVNDASIRYRSPRLGLGGVHP